MKQTNGNGNNNLFKLILMILEVIAICLMVLFFFSRTWTNRPEHFKNVSKYEEISKKTVFSEVHESTIPIPEKKIIGSIPTFEDTIFSYVHNICKDYPNIDPCIVLSVIYHESRFIPNVSSGKCVGLMQVSTYWHKDRAQRLGVTDFWDPYSNILLGVDLLNELLNDCNGDIYLALTRYNGGTHIGKYAREVVNLANLGEEYIYGILQ